MPARMPCPHCDRPCLVAERHMGEAVSCPHCKQTFTASRVAPPAPTPAAPPRLEVGAATTAGRVRERNEDSYLVHHVAFAAGDDGEDVALLAVADGMGGHEGGQEASRLVVQTVAATLAPVLAGALTGQFKASDSEALAENIDYALLEANRAVHRRAQDDPACKGMGATAAVVLAWGGRALVGHVGDCRVYHRRGERLTQLTKDQTLAARMVELGALTAKEALTHPARSQVAQAVGRYTELAPARHDALLQAGDCLILATGGLHAHLDDESLREELAKPAATAAERARRLTAAADERGGSDNCTVLCLRCW